MDEIDNSRDSIKQRYLKSFAGMAVQLVMRKA